MPYLVDGNNLAHVLGLSDGGLADREACAREVASFCRSRGAQAILVFDGPRAGGPLAGGHAGQVKVIFGEGRSADDLILRRVDESRHPRDFIVVTSDKSLGDRVRHRGASLMKAHEFARRLSRPPRRGAADGARTTPRETPAQIDAWLAVFDPKRR